MTEDAESLRTGEPGAGKAWDGGVVPVAVDGHVHFYPCFDADRFFQAARANFRAALGASSETSGGLATACGFLLLSESAGHAFFERLAAGAALPAGWTLERLPDDPLALRLRHRDGDVLYLVSGFQVVTRERIEVLTLITDRRLPDGRDVRETVSEAIRMGAVVVLPWGVGKWFGARGQLVGAVLRDTALRPLFIGDIAGRPRGWPRGGLFAGRRKHGVGLLPGSDALPLPGDETSVGSRGALLPLAVSESRPAESLRRVLLQDSGGGKSYGEKQPLARFLRNQIRLRLQKGSG